MSHLGVVSTLDNGRPHRLTQGKGQSDPMRIYRALWLAACLTVVGVGLGAGLVRSPASLAAAFSIFAVLAAMSTQLVSLCARRRPRMTGGRLLRRAMAAGAAAGAVVGLGVLLGPGALALGILLVSASPYVLRAYVRALTSVPVSLAAGLGSWMSPPAPDTAPQAQVPLQRAPIPTAPNVRLVTDQRLRGAWRTSFLVLQTRPRASDVVAIAEERQRYLDEFERRNPKGFEAWLARAPWASNIPVRFLRDTPTDQSEIDWDELTQKDS